MTNSFDPRYLTMLAQSIKAREMESQQQQQQQQQQQDQKAVIHTLLSSRELELLIKEFNPIRNRDLYASEWIRQIELLGKIHKWDSCHLLLYSTMRLQGVAKTWYEYSMDSISSWEDFKEELMNNFPRTIDTADIHGKLIAKKRLPEESIEEYFHTTVRMAKRIKLPDDAIKDYLVRGLQHSRHQIILSSIGPCSLTEFLQHMLRLEMDAQNNPPSNPPSSAKRSHSPDRTTVSSKKSVQSSSQQQSPKAPKQCYVCKMTTHFVAKCPNKFKILGNEPTKKKNSKKGCFCCGQTDHLAKDCTRLNVNRSQRDNAPYNPEDDLMGMDETLEDDYNDIGIDIDDEMGEQIDEVLDLAAM
uniref:CCHC-type domain-containing protein n=1 Tax=Lutzomyia longipalpis TaxID=7200 RepID=A0A1B0CY12_LUTLO